MFKIDEDGKIELLVDPKTPVRFQLRINPEFYGIWKMFRELGPGRLMSNTEIFEGFMACLISDHPWLETLAAKHRESVRGKAQVFRSWWEMTGGLPGVNPAKFGSSNQVGAPIRPGRDAAKRFNEPDEEWHQAFEAEIQERTEAINREQERA